MQSNLYLLVYKNKKMIKVGKANNVHIRFKGLERHWGEVNYMESYKFSASSCMVSKLEKDLHFFLNKYSIDLEKKDGYTEMFAYDALDIALKHIDYLVSHNVIPSNSLKKGIDRPRKNIIFKRKNRSYTNLKEKHDKMFFHISENIEKFKMVNRLLFVIIRNQSKIRYQYEILDDVIYFRVKINPGNYFNHEKIFRLFSFSLNDFNIVGGINCCSLTQIDDVLQLKIRLLTLMDEPSSSFLQYLSNQSVSILKLLPFRSCLLDEDLPIFRN